GRLSGRCAGLWRLDPATRDGKAAVGEQALRRYRYRRERCRVGGRLHCGKRGVAKINLMGWSWGTAIMGVYTAQHNDKVNRLVLYAPLWIFSTRPIIGGDGPLGAYRTVTKESAKARWLSGVAEDKKADLIPPGWFEQWADATWATDPESSKQSPPVLRAPNGVFQDLRTYWVAGQAQYDPGDIKVCVPFGMNDECRHFDV